MASAMAAGMFPRDSKAHRPAASVTSLISIGAHAFKHAIESGSEQENHPENLVIKEEDQKRVYGDVWTADLAYMLRVLSCVGGK